MPAPVIKPLERDELPADLQPLHDLGLARTGDATIIGVMAHQPDLLRWYFGEFYEGLFYNKNKGMTVDVRSKELLRLKLSKQHGCQFCNRFNTVEAAKSGITQEMLDAIFTPESPLFTDRDRAIIALGGEMMLQNMEGHLSPALHAQLKAHFSDAQIIELGFIAAVLTGVAKWIFTFDMVDREEICPIRLPAVA